MARFVKKLINQSFKHFIIKIHFSDKILILQVKHKTQNENQDQSDFKILCHRQ